MFFNPPEPEDVSDFLGESQPQTLRAGSKVFAIQFFSGRTWRQLPKQCKYSAGN
jgi:hypothetical protein